ncbi:hypothetical protein CAPTEDRAFT_198898 [Capitella teleta]|uniref:G-protein coupled receptors family 1 profile domain-containing protein n=1 Tax=Capitella teleta TaxID=283909 RepID=R7U6M8_CAPTE|nr:hypothetical protein CAPTEDRAFT_198898 [Capitella teleta]|eukprot:ELU01649.1 hypothetical protein CAPTEDRAFT_198898 [Capitella teleta]
MENNTRSGRDPHMLQPEPKTPLLVGLSFFVACINVLMLVILVKNEGLRRKISPIITSLAVADFLVGVTMGITSLLGNKRDGFSEFVTSSSVVASMLHLVLIAVDRCASVFAPLRYKVIVTRKLLYVGIAVVWVATMILFATAIFATNSYIGEWTLKIQLGLFTFVGASLLVLYAYLGKVACTQWMKMQAQRAPDQREAVPKATKVLMVVLGAYALFWGPYTVFIFAFVSNHHEIITPDLFFYATLCGVCNSVSKGRSNCSVLLLCGEISKRHGDVK